jgi:hypothetical protein
MLGALIAALGWELRKKRREIRKLDFEIQELRNQQAAVRLATIQEMNSLIKEAEYLWIRKRSIMGAIGPLDRFGLHFREFLVLAVAHLDDSAARTHLPQQRPVTVKPYHPEPREAEKIASEKRPDPLPLYREWQEVKPLADSTLSMETIRKIDFILRLLMMGRQENAGTATLTHG